MYVDEAAPNREVSQQFGNCIAERCKGGRRRNVGLAMARELGRDHIGCARQSGNHVTECTCRAGKPVQEEQSGVGWIARSNVGKLGSTGETHSVLSGQSHVKVPFCRLELELNSNERREFRMLPKSVWPVFLHGRAICQCPRGDRRAN